MMRDLIRNWTRAELHNECQLCLPAPHLTHFSRTGAQVYLRLNSHRLRRIDIFRFHDCYQSLGAYELPFLIVGFDVLRIVSAPSTSWPPTAEIPSRKGQGSRAWRRSVCRYRERGDLGASVESLQPRWGWRRTAGFTSSACGPLWFGHGKLKRACEECLPTFDTVAVAVTPGELTTWKSSVGMDLVGLAALIRSRRGLARAARTRAGLPCGICVR